MKFSDVNTRHIHPAYRAVSLHGLAGFNLIKAPYQSCSKLHVFCGRVVWQNLLIMIPNFGTSESYYQLSSMYDK